jgi:uracil-DNA glycosylase
MQITNTLRKQFGSWIDYLWKFITTEEFDKIFKHLRERKQVHKKNIIPASVDVFKSFEYTDSKQVRAIIVSMDPYNTITKKGVMVANGIPFDCSNTGIAQPSLFTWYGGITDTYGLDPDMDQTEDLSYLLKEQHVLLINSALTVEEGSAGIHAELWKPFMKFFFEDVINEFFKGLPIVLVGKQAQTLKSYIDPLRHYVLEVEHPAAASYQKRNWDCKNLFKWVNTILLNNNGPEYQIQWYKKRLVAESKIAWEVKENKEWVRKDMPWDNISVNKR